MKAWWRNKIREQELMISLLMWIDCHTGFHMLIIALKLEQLEAFERGGFCWTRYVTFRGPKLLLGTLGTLE